MTVRLAALALKLGPEEARPLVAELRLAGDNDLALQLGDLLDIARMQGSLTPGRPIRVGDPIDRMLATKQIDRLEAAAADELMRAAELAVAGIPARDLEAVGGGSARLGPPAPAGDPLMRILLDQWRRAIAAEGAPHADAVGYVVLERRSLRSVERACHIKHGALAELVRRALRRHCEVRGWKLGREPGTQRRPPVPAVVGAQPQKP